MMRFGLILLVVMFCIELVIAFWAMFVGYQIPPGQSLLFWIPVSGMGIGFLIAGISWLMGKE